MVEEKCPECHGRRLKPEALATINQQVLPQIEIARGMSVRIEGNTDSMGDRASNQTLSELRARAIVDYLVSRGVPAVSSADGTYSGAWLAGGASMAVWSTRK